MAHPPGIMWLSTKAVEALVICWRAQQEVASGSESGAQQLSRPQKAGSTKAAAANGSKNQSFHGHHRNGHGRAAETCASARTRGVILLQRGREALQRTQPLSLDTR